MFRDGARYNGIGPWMKGYFGARAAKIAIDGGFTCPNRDGTLSFDGCTYCSRRGSGDFAGSRALSISDQMRAQLNAASGKWDAPVSIAYFQNFTNTYAHVSELRQKYEEALAFPGCRGIAIATRPDCLSSGVLDLLSELNSRTFLWVELGLQTSNDRTAAIINRCCSTAVYDEAVDNLTARNIRVVTHVIFGLPGEEHNDMLETVRHVCSKNIFGIKIHSLLIMSGTPLADEYAEQQMYAYAGKELVSARPPIVPLTRDSYITAVADALEIIPPQITIHRLTGDSPPESLIAPLWSLDKRAVLNGINKELKRRGTLQGIRAV